MNSLEEAGKYVYDYEVGIKYDLLQCKTLDLLLNEYYVLNNGEYTNFESPFYDEIIMDDNHYLHFCKEKLIEYDNILKNVYNLYIPYFKNVDHILYIAVLNNLEYITQSIIEFKFLYTKLDSDYIELLKLPNLTEKITKILNTDYDIKSNIEFGEQIVEVQLNYRQSYPNISQLLKNNKEYFNIIKEQAKKFLLTKLDEERKELDKLSNEYNKYKTPLIKCLDYKRNTLGYALENNHFVTDGYIPNI